MPQQADIDNTDPLWAKILQLLYSRGLGGEEPGTEPWTYREKTADTIINELGARDKNVEDSLQYMADIGLIEERESDSSDDTKYAYGLTQKGFDIAHERALRGRQQELIENQTDATDTLANFTIILGVTALIQALAAIVSLPQYRIPLSAIYAGLLMILLYKKDDWLHGM